MMEHLTTDTLTDYVHGELPPAEDALVHAHLQACAACQAEFELETSLSEALRTAARDEEYELPSMVKARIWEAVRAERPSPFAAFAAFLRPAIAVPTAAILIVVTYFASPLGHPQQVHAKTVDAMYYLEQHAAEELQNPLIERNVSSPILETTEASNNDLTIGTRTAAAAALDAVE